MFSARTKLFFRNR
jgi:dihydrofolate reductase